MSERLAASVRGAPFPALPLAVATGLVAVAFAPGMLDMAGRWTAGDGYYAHGPLVPAVCAWVLWRERAGLRRTARGSSRVGLALVGGAVALLAVSLAESVNFGQNLALLGAVAGTALVIFGAPVVRRAWFALAFLAFMVPLPQVALIDLTFRLKMLAADIAVAILSGVGIAVVGSGNTIHLADVTLTVDDACSGLKGLIAIVAIAAVFAYLERSRARAALALALAVPVALFANVLRILVLCGLALAGSEAAREGPLHDATGLAVYGVAIAVFLGIRSRPGGGDEAEGARDLPAADQPPVVHRAPPPGRVVLLCLVLGAGALLTLALGFDRPAVAQSRRTPAVPQTIGPWAGVDAPLSPRVFVLLETEDVLLRYYVRAGSTVPVDLCIVHAQGDRGGAHPPEQCLVGEGFTPVERDVRTLRAGGREIPANRMVVRTAGTTLLVYYWYRAGGREWTGYLEHRLARLARRALGEAGESTLIRVSTRVDLFPEGLESAEARIAAFAAEALGEAIEVLP